MLPQILCPEHCTNVHFHDRLYQINFSDHQITQHVTSSWMSISVREDFVNSFWPDSMVNCYTHREMTWLENIPPIRSEQGRRRKKQHIMQQCHVLSVAITTSSGTRTLQMERGAHLHGNVHVKNQSAMVSLRLLAADGPDLWPYSASASL